jgi:hypothetical protein
VGEAHPQIKKGIVKNEAAKKATRFIMRTKVIRGTFDASIAVR